MTGINSCGCSIAFALWTCYNDATDCLQQRFLAQLGTCVLQMLAARSHWKRLDQDSGKGAGHVAHLAAGKGPWLNFLCLPPVLGGIAMKSVLFGGEGASKIIPKSRM